MSKYEFNSKVINPFLIIHNLMTSQLDFLRIENFRSLKMNENLHIKPINILVGRNSAGKSTFARSFPLLRQSTEARKRAPILWFGDRVDFGSFNECISQVKTKAEKEIFFTFGLTLTSASNNNFRYKKIQQEEINKFEVRIGIQQASNSRSQASSLKIKAYGYEIDVGLSEGGAVAYVKVDDLTWSPGSNHRTFSSYGSILPNVSFYIATESPDERTFIPHELYSNEIKQIFSSKKFSSQDNLILTLIKSAPLQAKGELQKHVLTILENASTGEISTSRWKAITQKLADVEPMLFLSKIGTLIDTINAGLKEYYSGVKYIEPLRATALRYYRKQELAIDEIDSKGENLAMFLDNLTSWELNSFSNWTLENFGFSAKTKKEGGHVEILITDKGSTHPTNLTDIGFGFSQILPVITQIWFSSNGLNPNKKKSSCVVIEQPELHLHPEFQARLADVFAAAVAKKTHQTTLIIETHSNHIINKLGQLISQGKLSNDDVQILIFDKKIDSYTEIKNAGFDSEGYLINWPIGFFEPEA